MAYYKLVPTGQRRDLQTDEIILARDEQGEVQHALSISRAAEIPEEHLENAYALAGRLGMKVVEADAPPEEEEVAQPVGADVAGQARVSEGAAGAQLDQAGAQTAAATAQRTGGGTPPANS